MANFKEFRLKIDGRINGVDFTPETIPMARLLEYLTDLAQIMGHKEAIHFIRVAEGSAQPVLLVDVEEVGRVTYRVQQAQRGQSTNDANIAYKRFDARLREDDGVAELVNFESKTNVLEFPGRKLDLPMAYGPVREAASLVGELIRVGGKDETVPIWLTRADGKNFYCEADRNVARQLGPLLYKQIRVHGLATWQRNKEGEWILEHFRVQSYDPEPLSDAGLAETIHALRDIPDNGWSNVEDPLEELRKIRHGEDKPTQ